MDIFAGSNTTGFVSEQLNRKWLSFDNTPEYVAMSIFRFVPKDFPKDILRNIYTDVLNGKNMNVDNLALIQFQAV